MPYTVDFSNVSARGLESSPVAGALAGLRANEARYFSTHYHMPFTVIPADQSTEVIDYVRRILKHERDIVISAKPLETASLRLTEPRFGPVRWTFVFYENGLAVNVLYPTENPKGRAVGFKLSEGMEVPSELADKFRFARQKSKLAGTIRGSYFVIKGDYSL